MSPESRVCSDECHYSMNLDGKEIKVVGTGSVKTLNDGSLSEMVIVWMRPQSFKKIAEAKEISVQINSVSFNLTEQQMEGLRQMVPFLRYRLLPF
jgi:hypothetical protein